jgi:glycerol-3-phosphate O-acyltransferase
VTEPRDPPRAERSGGEAPRPDAAPGAPRRGLLARWFEPVKVPRDAPEELRALAARGSLVFVMRSSSLLSFLYLRWFLRRAGLPPLRAAQGLHGLLGWIARVRRSRRAFEEAVQAGDASVVFLGRPAPKDPFAALVRVQRDLFQPVQLVPVLLVWSRRPQKLAGSVWDVLYGAPEAPNAFANAIAFLRNYRRALFGVGRALDLKAALLERPQDPDAVLARKVRGVLHQHLAREFRTAVGPPLKAPSRVREKVLRDRGLRAALDAVVQESGRDRATVLAEAERDLKEIASRYDPRFVGLVRGFLAWAFGRLYTSVEVDEEGLARVKRAAAGAPIVLCPSHKSYVDFLVLPLVLYDHGMTPPHVAAGINLAFWPFDKIARRGGAFFIRRKVKGDRIYTAVLRAYVKHLLRERFPQEFYVEGGRSRTGKLLSPKTGLVSMQVDAWLDGAADDVVFVPVAIDYEKLIEASSYARELAGGEKQKETLRGLLGAVRVLFRRYERVYVQFEQPISLRRVAEERLGASAAGLAVDVAWGGEEARAGGAAGAGARRDASAEAKRQLVQALANRIAYGISRAVTITPVGLVGASLLSDVRRGLAAAEVARRIELLRYIAAEGGARFARGLGGAPSDPLQPGPIADAIRRLEAGGVVRSAVAAGETIYQVPDDKRPVLDYHRNAVIHRYVAPAIVAAAARAGDPDAALADVRARALALSRLLKLEFMYRVDAGFDEIFEQNVAFLVRVRALAREGDRLRAGAGAATVGFLAELVRPYLEAYRLAAATALELLVEEEAGVPRDRRALVKEALDRGQAAFLAGGIAIRESLSKATLDNAVEWMIAQGVVAEHDGRLTLGDRDALRDIMDGMSPFLAR